MKAVQINSYGGPEVLEVNEVSEPKVSKDQVLVEVYAASINPIDWKVCAGYLQKMMPLQFPVILGGDFSGTVIEVGEGVSDLKTGDDVYGQAGFLNGGSGSFAQFALAPVNKIARKPEKLDHIHASALPLVGSSALQALEDHIKLKHGEKILIHGGAGGIGHISIQLAKNLGAYVATTASEKDKEFVKSLGADLIIDFKNEKFEDKIKDYDAVFDTVGGETSDRSFLVLKKGGVIVSMVGQPNPELAKKYDVTAIGQGTKGTPNHFNKLSELVDAGKIKVNVDKIFPLDQVREAFRYIEEGHPQGKVVLKIK